MRIAGVDIGGTSVKIGVFEDGVLLQKLSAHTPFGDPEGMCNQIAQLLDGCGVQAVGVGTAGSVDPKSGTVAASNLGWEGVPLQQMLSSRLNVPVFVDNDAQVALIAEWHDGVCKGAECAVYLTLGTGIGGAMIVDGKPYRGPHNLGAEFGHMITHPGGPRCACGRRGCLEYYASATALRRMSGGKSAYAVIESAKAADPHSLSLFERYVHELCIGLSNLVMIFDPQVIVLGGGVSGAGEFLSAACEKELRRLFDDTTDPLFCRILTAKHQNDAGILGAAILAEQHMASIKKRPG